METISSKNMLKSVMNGLTTQSTATIGQLIMLHADDGTPNGKMQAPTGEQGTPLVFDENNQATATTEPSVTAGSATMGKVYLVGPEAGTKWQWITLKDDSTNPATYSWLQIGPTDVDLSQYARAEYATETAVRNIVKNWQPSA